MYRRALGAMSLLVLGLGLVSLVGCRRSSSSRASASASASTSARVPLPPLAAPSWLVPLEASATGARVAVPLGTQVPRPILIALPGGADRPEWRCGSYHHVTQRSAFVLCPGGLGDGERPGLGPTAATRAELRALLPALKTRFGDHLAKGAVVLAALGASVPQAIEIALEEPRFFSRLVLVDGSLDGVSSGMVQRFATGGGKRVLAVCTRQSACAPDVVERLLVFERAGVETRALLPERGAGLDGDVTALLAREYPWLVRDEAGWQ